MLKLLFAEHMMPDGEREKDRDEDEAEEEKRVKIRSFWLLTQQSH